MNKPWHCKARSIFLGALVFVFLQPTMQAQELNFNPSNLIVLYQFEGNVQDASQNQINGEGFNIDYGDGHEGEGLLLMGNGGVRIPDSPLVTFTREFTFDAWVKATGRFVGGCRLFEYGNENISLTLNHLGSLDFAYQPKNGGVQSLRSNGDKAVLYTDRWMHVAAVLGDGLMLLYIDGFEVGRKKIPFSLQEIRQTEDGSTIGNSPGGTHGFRGYMDDVRLSASVSPAIPPLTVELTSYPSMGKLDISANITGTHYQDANVTASAKLFSSVGNRPIQSIALRPFELGIATGQFNITTIPPGEYKINLAVSEVNGQQLLEKSATYMKLDRQPWEGTAVRTEGIVPYPWTPVQSSGDTLRCWGREYIFAGQSLLPTEIRSQSVSLLSAPVSLSIKRNGEFLKSASPGNARLDSSAERITRYAHAADGNMLLNVRTGFEFDGMLRMDVTISPYRTIGIDTVFLDIPLTRAAALYYLYYPEEWDIGVPNAGAIPENGWASPFKPYVWIGNNERGLCWFAESQRNWSLLQDEPVIRIIPREDDVLLRVAVVNKPVSLNRAFSFTFGIQASPIKPKPDRARAWRFGPDADGITIACVWANPRLSQWYTFPKPVNPDSFAARIDSIHAKNRQAVFYSSIHYLSSNAPEWEYNEGDWWAYRPVYGQSDIVPFGHLSMPICSRREDFKEFILSLYRDFFARYDVDGMYFDNGPLRVCNNPHHPECSFTDEYGVTHPTYPWFDVRDVKKGIYALLKKDKPAGVIVDHLSMSPLLPLASFCDAYVDGEQFYNENFTGDYLGTTALEKVRTELMGHQFGLVNFFLPELHGELAISAGPTENLMAMILLHDMNLWMTFCNPDVVRKTWEAIDRFGIAEARFHPYWSQEPAAETSIEGVKISAYLKSGTEALIVAANITDEPVEAEVALKPVILELPESGIAAEDGFTGESIDGSDNLISIRIEPKNFRLIRLHARQ